MVHALAQAIRVMRPGGIIIDLRPFALRSGIEILHDGVSESAGNADLSLSRHLDLAADKAFRDSTSVGWIKKVRASNFKIGFYWNSAADMFKQFKDKWQDDIRVPKDVERQAKVIYRQYKSKARMRLWMPTKLTVYEKV